MPETEIRRTFPAGAVIFAEGDPGDCAYIIEHGSAEISVFRGGEKISVAERGPGEIFGEMAIIDANPRAATVTALTECRALLISREQMTNRLAGLDPMLRVVLGVVLERVRDNLGGARGPGGDAAPMRREEAERRAQTFNAAISRIEIEHELRRGIHRGQIEFHLQPIVRSSDGVVAGYEALARWRSPDRGLVSPGVFIPVAEESGLIRLISRLAVAAACGYAALSRARRGAGRKLHFSANVTAEDLCDPDFYDHVVACLAHEKLEPSALTLEITESTLLDNAEQVLAMLERYRALGVRISIDDFGAGYSNFSYLARYPVQVLKIDKSVIDQMTEGARGAKLMEAIVNMAQVLGLTLVAEGVETAAQAAQLRDLGCDLIQGFYFGKPAPFESIVAEAEVEVEVEVEEAPASA